MNSFFTNFLVLYFFRFIWFGKVFFVRFIWVNWNYMRDKVIKHGAGDICRRQPFEDIWRYQISKFWSDICVNIHGLFCGQKLRSIDAIRKKERKEGKFICRKLNNVSYVEFNVTVLISGTWNAGNLSFDSRFGGSSFTFLKQKCEIHNAI